MDTYQVKIIKLTNAEGGFNKIGDGTMVFDDLRDELRVTGHRAAGWVTAVLIVFFILAICFPIPTNLFVSTSGDYDSIQTAIMIGFVLRGMIVIALIVLTVFRHKVFPKREVAVRFSQSELGMVGRGTTVMKGPVERSVTIFEVQGPNGIKKWVEVLPLSEADAQAIMNQTASLRDG